MSLVFVRSVFQLREAVYKGVADGVRIEIGDVEHLDARPQQHAAIERCRGVSQIGKHPDERWVV